MDILFVDFETYYDQDYSLSRMSEAEYILDATRYQTIMCSFRLNGNPTEVYIGHAAVAAQFAKYDPSQVALCSHNMRFDGAIAAWRFGFVPKMYLDTLSMARATIAPVSHRVSLRKCAEYFRLPPKGVEVVMAKGRRLENFTPAELKAYAEYCAHDTDLCAEIYYRMRRAFQPSELMLIDMVQRMFIQPATTLDPNTLALHLADVRNEQAQIMAKVAHHTKDVFTSNMKFAKLLEDHGVDVPKKISPTTGQPTFALAKNDRVFKELCEDDSQTMEVQALLAARLNSKSTIEETRTQALLRASQLQWGPASAGFPSVSGWAAIPLKHYGAHTGRASGDGGFNWQNFKRGSKIHDAVVAPPGMRIVHKDSSQIEVRMLAMMSGSALMIQQFREGRDIYSEFASVIYGRHVTRADKKGRFVGKTCILGLGYQTGGPKLRHTLFIGNGGQSVVVDEQEAWKYVRQYRKTYEEVPALWEQGNWMLEQMHQLGTTVMTDERMQRSNAFPYPYVEFDDRAIWLPNGMPIQYPDLQHNSDGFHFDRKGVRSNIYGGKVCENVDQALARIVVTDIMLRVFLHTGYRPFLFRHDSLDYCVPEGQAAAFSEYLEAEFKVPPKWIPDIPLNSEGGWGVTLGAAERMENV